jgi:hypothetical protein
MENKTDNPPKRKGSVISSCKNASKYADWAEKCLNSKKTITKLVGQSEPRF